MTRLLGLRAFGLTVFSAALGVAVQAQVGDPGTLIKEKLESQMKLTKIAADRSDIVTAGDIVVLHKDGLIMCNTTSPYPGITNYKEGALKTDWKTSIISAGSSASCSQRKFVSGEKFWVTGILLQKDAIAVNVYSDPYNDTRYYGEIKFPFPKKGSVPPVDDFVKTVSEVITVQPGDDKGSDQAAQQAPPQPAAAPSPTSAPAPAPAQPMTAIAAPPPPADAPPPTINIGETKDQVTAAFGAPTRTAKLGAKEIYFYKDMKVTFTNGKVSNVE